MNIYDYTKRVIRFLLIKLPSDYIAKLGFVHYYRYHVHGPRERLIIKDSNPSFVNTLFNTRSGTITIEEGCIFGHNCMVLTGKHNYKAKDSTILRNDVVDKDININIGTGTWIASGVTIVGSVKIGKHCVLAAGSVVTGDIPDFSFAAGIPAKVIRKL